MKLVTIVGTGMGPDTVTAEGLRAIEGADVLFGAPRMLADYAYLNKRAEAVYDPDPEVNEAVKQFVRHRRILKKPMTDYAVDRFLAKLRGLSGDPTEQVRLINNAIEHGWQTVYEDKKPEGKIDWSAV